MERSAVELLLKANADIEAKNNDGETPLDWAREKGHTAKSPRYNCFGDFEPHNMTDPWLDAPLEFDNEKL